MKLTVRTNKSTQVHCFAHIEPLNIEPTNQLLFGARVCLYLLSGNVVAKQCSGECQNTLCFWWQLVSIFRPSFASV